MVSNFLKTLLLIGFASSATLRAEDPDLPELPGNGDVELSAEAPDEQLDMTASPEGVPDLNTRQAAVPQFEDGATAVDAPSDQSRLLRYHKQLLVDREAETGTQEDSPHTFHLGFGALQELTPLGSVDFQVTLADHFTFGALIEAGSLSSSLGNSKSLGGASFGSSLSLLHLGGAFNYYSRRPYEGIWVQLGVIGQVIRGTIIASASTAAANATEQITVVPVFWNVGWRWLDPAKNLTSAFGIGVFGYFFQDKPFIVFPTVRLQFGFAWNIFPH